MGIPNEHYKAECDVDEVNSINEFIEKIESNNYRLKMGVGSRKLVYFRGENRDYGITKITASAFRPENEDFDYVSACKEFYEEVYPKLKGDAQESFLAFCQHHGIPTNLIDVTSNPLVALWFACQESKEMADGFVYCFHDDFIDITDFVKKIGVEHFPISVSSKLTKFGDYRLFDDYSGDLIDDLIQKAVDCLGKCIKRSGHFYQDNDDIDRIIKQDADKYNLPHLAELYLQPDVAKQFSQSKLWLNDDSDEEKSFLSVCQSDYISAAAFAIIFDFVKATKILDNSSACGSEAPQKLCDEIPKGYTNFGDEYHSEAYYSDSVWKEKAAFIPNLLYKPFTDFNRFVNQNSAFLFQLGITKWHNNFNNTHPFSGATRFAPSIAIKIPASKKAAILRVLDKLAINRKTVYSDFDSIAKYIVNEKHY